MTMEEKNKSKGWFKTVLSNQNEPNQNSKEEQEFTEAVEDPFFIDEETINPVSEAVPSDNSGNKPLFTKDNQDKISLDMIVSLENMLKDRQLVLYKNKGLEDQLYTANEIISRLKHEQVKKDQLVQEKNKEISGLESKLTNKQMSYDQLLEDYKDHQNASNFEYEKISNQLEKEIQKYNKLNEESTNAQYQSMLKVKNLDERIRDLEVENQRYAEQYEKILDEKTQLMETINDFTERMSFSFNPKANGSNTPAE
ncbi:hypothetical protein BCI9360_01206 [Bacillus sp. CECT 9360]|nr:hypothetical protein BCI9360_01206 [Bacillus sp. CECT 9360]